LLAHERRARRSSRRLCFGATLLAHGYSRFPVHREGIEDVVGYVSVKDMLAAALRRDRIVLPKLVRAPYFVPEAKQAVPLLNEMREQQLHLAVVVDEHGGFSGIVTMEDLLEELVGEVFSEHVSKKTYSVTRQADGSAVVSGMAPVREVNRTLGVELPEDGPWTTIAGLFLALANHMPGRGESVRTPSGDLLEVIDASPRRIRSIRISPRSEVDGPAREPADGA
jgi:putative hemolysin